MKPILITEKDYQRLTQLLREQHMAKGPRMVEALRNDLSRAQVVPSEKIPQDVITMNSRIRLKKKRGAAEMELSIVFPQDADIVKSNISVLAPIGRAVLGCKVGDEVKWPAAQGAVAYQVAEMVYQSEAAGDLHL